MKFGPLIQNPGSATALNIATVMSALRVITCTCISNSANPAGKCALASEKTISTLGMIKTTTVSRVKDVILRLSKWLFRQKLDPAAIPCLKLEMVENLTWRMEIPRSELNVERLTTPERKMSRGDLIEIYNIIIESEAV